MRKVAPLDSIVNLGSSTLQGMSLVCSFGETQFNQTRIAPLSETTLTRPTHSLKLLSLELETDDELDLVDQSPYMTIPIAIEFLE